MAEVKQSPERIVEIGNVKITTPAPDKDFCHVKLDKSSYSTLIVDYKDIGDLIEALDTIRTWHDKENQ